jgi:hypothetical protein
VGRRNLRRKNHVIYYQPQAWLAHLCGLIDTVMILLDVRAFQNDNDLVISLTLGGTDLSNTSSLWVLSMALPRLDLATRQPGSQAGWGRAQ